MYLVSTNAMIGIVTNSRRISAERVLKAHNLFEVVNYLITSDDVVFSKPHPEPYLKLLQISGVDASNALAIEDSDIGKQSALSAKVSTLLITF
jgi:HAD superfamily hydrolase (TIGR01509 family)